MNTFVQSVLMLILGIQFFFKLTLVIKRRNKDCNAGKIVVN